jgi:uncharacterized membrane protein HdeD (DUF308 family)
MATQTMAAPPTAPVARDPSGLHPGWLLFRALIAIVFGIVALTMPLVTLGSLVLLFAAYLLADGAIALIAAVRAARLNRAWGGFLLEAVANLLAGVLAVLWPAITLLVLVALSGVWAIVSGAFLAYAGWRDPATRGRWLWLLAGALSIVWGALLLIAPVPGAVVMTIWLGAYALVFGVMLLAAAWRLRRGKAALA